MSRLSILAIFALLGSTTLLKSQTSYEHALGLSAVGAKGVSPGLGLSYFPRLVLASNDETSVSIGAPISAAFHFWTASDVGGNLGVIFDLPLTFDLNIGHASSAFAGGRFGMFFGAGTTYYHRRNINGDVGGEQSLFGPVGHAGSRFQIGDLSLAIRGAAMFDVANEALGNYSFAAYINFGIY